MQVNSPSGATDQIHMPTSSLIRFSHSRGRSTLALLPRSRYQTTKDSPMPRTQLFKLGNLSSCFNSLSTNLIFGGGLERRDEKQFPTSRLQGLFAPFPVGQELSNSKNHVVRQLEALKGGVVWEPPQGGKRWGCSKDVFNDQPLVYGPSGVLQHQYSHSSGSQEGKYPRYAYGTVKWLI